VKHFEIVVKAEILEITNLEKKIVKLFFDFGMVNDEH